LNRLVYENPHPLALQTKFEEIMQYSHMALKQFPKNERFQLCADIKQAVDTAMHLIIRMQKRYAKKTTLQDIDVEIEYLRVLVRSANAYGYINTHKLQVWMKHVDEAGRICGGLIKFYNEKARTTS